MTSFMAAVWALLAYIYCSLLLFGGPFQALALLLMWRDRLGLTYWQALLPLSVLLAAIGTSFAKQHGVHRQLLPALFIVFSMGLSAVLVGGYAEIRRVKIISEFAPDQEIHSSIFSSFRNAPRKFQPFLHGAALKNCRPFAWSYRRMEFYALPPNVAANVLPKDWIEACKIRRTR
ncbi:hypothetical protein [Cohaesibacter haloalkalitolerans]|uniref:hypothetical protein n=1 Tax=Cohaesibacter haloalkalitolerans TaxID=1162980 RepID=UPI0013C40637|nr:hypothetical protein [Cohaesibacter haloalkalitolerans]